MLKGVDMEDGKLDCLILETYLRKKFFKKTGCAYILALTDLDCEHVFLSFGLVHTYLPSIFDDCIVVVFFIPFYICENCEDHLQL